jgi:hypothetical protein
MKTVVFLPWLRIGRARTRGYREQTRRFRFDARMVQRSHGGIVVTPDTRRQIAAMLGEFMREAGVLIAVLAPLELLVTHGTLTIKGILVIVSLAVPSLVFGLILGLERR